MTAKATAVTLSETVMDIKFIPTGESPRNNPIKPAKPKLSAIESTRDSIRSILFLPMNRMFTRQ